MRRWMCGRDGSDDVLETGGLRWESIDTATVQTNHPLQGTATSVQMTPVYFVVLAYTVVAEAVITVHLLFHIYC